MLARCTSAESTQPRPPPPGGARRSGCSAVGADARQRARHPLASVRHGASASSQQGAGRCAR
eukprot:6655060-Alexandrium_andersonii.AAC.1